MKLPKTQFIYHPENDGFVAGRILEKSPFKQLIDISKKSIKQLNNPSESYWQLMEPVDVIVLLIGSTFDRVAPYIYNHDNFLAARKGIFGIDISSVPDQWGEVRTKANVWLGFHHYSLGKTSRDVIKLHSPPPSADSLDFIQRCLPSWVEEAHKFAQSGYSSGAA